VRPILLIISALVLSALGGLSYAKQTELPASTVAAIEQACKTLVLDYASHRDQERRQAFADLFTVNGTLSVNGENLAGREELAGRFQSPAQQTFRHVMSNIRIVAHSETRASGTSYALIFAGPAKAGGDASPIEVASFAAMGEYYDEFVRTEDGWRIASRRFAPIFVPDRQ